MAVRHDNLSRQFQYTRHPMVQLTRRHEAKLNTLYSTYNDDVPDLYTENMRPFLINPLAPEFPFKF